MCLSADATGDDAVNVQDLMTVLANFGCTMEDCGHPCGQLHEYQDGTDPNDGDGAAVDDRMCLSADATGDDAVNVQDLMTVLANFGCTMEDCGHPCGQLHEYLALDRTQPTQGSLDQ